MNGKAVSYIPSNLSKGGVLSSSVATTIKNLGSNLGDPPLTVQSFSKELSTTSDSYPSVTNTFDITKSGYTPLGIVGFRTSKNGFGFVQRYVSGNSCIIRLYCDSQYLAIGTTVTAYVWILYIKN